MSFKILLSNSQTFRQRFRNRLSTIVEVFETIFHGACGSYQDFLDKSVSDNKEATEPKVPLG